MNFKNKYYAFSIFIYFVLILSFIEWYLHLYTRSILFFLLTSIAYTLITIKIFIYPEKKYYLHIFSDIFLLSIFLRFSIYYNFPTVYGYDPFTFVGHIKNIISTGFLTPDLEKYIGFPFYHILVVIFNGFSGFSIKDSYFIGSIIEVFCGLFVLIICKNLFNIKAGLLATSLILIAPYYFYWGFWIIPMTLSMNFYIFIVYFIVKQKEEFNKLIVPFLIILLTSIFTHPIGSVIIMITFIVFYIYPNIGPIKDKVISIQILLFTAVSTYIHWSLTTSGENIDLFSNLMIRLAITIRARTLGIYDITRITAAPLMKFTSIFLIDLPFVLLLFFGLLGSLYAIDKIVKNKKFIYIELLITTLLLVSITYLSGLISITSVEPARWFTFIEILLIIFASNGLIIIFNRKSLKNYKIFACFTILFIFIFSSMTTPLSNTESAFYSDEFIRRAALTSSELSATVFFNNYYSNKIFVSYDYLLINMTSIYLDELYVTPDKPLVVRTYDVEHGLLVEDQRFAFYPNLEFNNYINSSDKLFDNNKVQGYLRK